MCGFLHAVAGRQHWLMIFCLSAVQLAARLRVLSLVTLVFANLVFSVPTIQLLRRDSIDQQLTVKAACRCSTLDEDDVRSRECLVTDSHHLLNIKSVPGWPKVEKYVSDTFGASNFTVKINPYNVCGHRYSSFSISSVPTVQRQKGCHVY